MSKEALAEAPPEDDVVVDAEADNEGQTQEEAPEDKAARMGWRPKEEYRGDPDKWVDAETFLKRGEENPALAKAQIKQLEKALENARGEIADMKSTFAEFRDYHSRTAQRAFQRAMRELQDRQATAVAEGDVGEVQAITKEMVELQTEMEAPKAEAPKDPLKDPEFQKRFSEWTAENPWFENDPDMTAFAQGLGQRLANQGMAPADQLVEVTKRVREAFPHKFQNPARRNAAAVEGATGARRNGGKTYADLPIEAKAFCDRLVKQNLITREQYVKDYAW